MTTNERARTSRRTRPSSRQVSDQVARAVRAHSAVEHARRTLRLEVYLAERKVAAATQWAATETARLAALCGSVETAAGVLGLEPDEARRLIRRAQRPAEPPGTQRRKY